MLSRALAASRRVCSRPAFGRRVHTACRPAAALVSAVRLSALRPLLHARPATRPVVATVAVPLRRALATAAKADPAASDGSADAPGGEEEEEKVESLAAMINRDDKLNTPEQFDVLFGKRHKTAPNVYRSAMNELHSSAVDLNAAAANAAARLGLSPGTGSGPRTVDRAELLERVTGVKQPRGPVPPPPTANIVASSAPDAADPNALFSFRDAMAAEARTRGDRERDEAARALGGGLPSQVMSVSIRDIGAPQHRTAGDAMASRAGAGGSGESVEVNMQLPPGLPLEDQSDAFYRRNARTGLHKHLGLVGIVNKLRKTKLSVDPDEVHAKFARAYEYQRIKKEKDALERAQAAAVAKAKADAEAAEQAKAKGKGWRRFF